MARIDLDGLAHAYRENPQTPADYALRPMTMTWQDGGAYALLGPSGCGKTTLLNIISGLVRPSQGRVLFDGRDVTDLPTEARNIAQVFQFPVIYDTMTVHDNLAFPLRNRRVPEAEVRSRVSQVAELLELTGDLRRRASGLSADMKQKISLGRGLVRRDVAAILFDEPLTVIDPHLKWQLRSKLKQIHHELKLSLIYVTHDQVEALTFADQVVLMQGGEVVQAGTPQSLFEEPEHTFVGYFIGSPGMNLLPCTAVPGGGPSPGQGAVQIGDARVPLDGGVLSRAQGALTLGIRPEFLGCSNEAAPGALSAEIERVDDLGNYKIVTARLGGQTLRAKLPEDAAISAGPGYLSFPPNQTRLYAGDRIVR
ncbi:ABC transporter ATP-binding protein [Deinococcus koreensis]|uniref:ABC transporter ATP-binding protein n=1 Tax=Deinococcus koreensis TaxID=2054903 RepID=A0A2K3UT46_9DEIO|nr:ABC transporter ATP-binding protein [Deinococcus koreensis]PNY79713.1 ABC transporter ATP-binding protein [Deinococcus koreensis]